MRVINSVQYLRGFAAISVLLFHLGERFGVPFNVGSAGVDVFFVISGFIMWVTTAGKLWTPQQFMMRRIIRIVPLYWIVIGVTAVATLLKPQFLYGSDLSTYNFFGSLLFVPEVKNDAFHPVVLQGWTLTYEMFFYSVFAIGLLIVEKWRFWLLTIVFGLLFLLQPFIPAVHLRTLANPIIVEFLLGVALAQLWVSGRPIPLWAAALTLFVGLALFASVDDLVPSLPRLFRWGGPAVMVVGGSVFIERAWTMKRVSILGLLGDASYSIYLWHVVTAALIDGLLLKLKLPLMFHAVSVGALTLASTVTLYLLIEKPIIQFFAGTIDHPLQARSAKPAH